MGSAPVLPNGGRFAVRAGGCAAGRALPRRFVIETEHAASSIACHRPLDLREAEPRCATEPLHGDLPFAIRPLDRLLTHAEFRRQFLDREQLLLHAPSFRYRSARR